MVPNWSQTLCFESRGRGKQLCSLLTAVSVYLSGYCHPTSLNHGRSSSSSFYVGLILSGLISQTITNLRYWKQAFNPETVNHCSITSSQLLRKRSVYLQWQRLASTSYVQNPWFSVGLIIKVSSRTTFCSLCLVRIFQEKSIFGHRGKKLGSCKSGKKQRKKVQYNPQVIWQRSNWTAGTAVYTVYRGLLPQRVWISMNWCEPIGWFDSRMRPVLGTGCTIFETKDKKELAILKNLSGRNECILIENSNFLWNYARFYFLFDLLKFPMNRRRNCFCC